MVLNVLDGQASPLPLAVFQLAGNQVEMGRQHGQLLRNVGGYESALAYYPRMAEWLMRGGSVSLLERWFPSAMRPFFAWWLRRLERDRPADLLARSHAFYRALGVSPKMARHLMAMDLFQNVVGLASRAGQGGMVNPLSQRGFPACSTLAAWGEATEDGRLLVARNFDFPGVGTWDSAPAVVFCSPDTGVRYGFVTCRGADVPGITAFNEAGLTLTFHTRLHQHISFSGMAAVDLGHEVVRQARSLDEAIALIRRKPIASTWGLMLASASERRAVVVETTAKGVGVTEARPDEPFVGCTNHYRHPDLHEGEVMPCSAWLPGTASRLSRLEALAREAMSAGGMTVPRLWSVLGDRLDPHEPGQMRVAGVLVQPIGVQSVVMDPERQTIDVTTGRCPASCGSTQTIPWKWSTEPGVVEMAPRDLTDVGSDAYRWYLRAVQLEGRGGHPQELEAALMKAAEWDPKESTLQLLAGGACLRRGTWIEARRCFEQGLQHEPSPFHRGRLLFWAARAAEAQGDVESAARFRHELHQLAHPWLRPIQEAAGKRVSVRQLRQIVLHVGLGDLGPL